MPAQQCGRVGRFHLPVEISGASGPVRCRYFGATHRVFWMEVAHGGGVHQIAGQSSESSIDVSPMAPQTTRNKSRVVPEPVGLPVEEASTHDEPLKVPAFARSDSPMNMDTEQSAPSNPGDSGKWHPFNRIDPNDIKSVMDNVLRMQGTQHALLKARPSCVDTTVFGYLLRREAGREG